MNMLNLGPYERPTAAPYEIGVLPPGNPRPDGFPRIGQLPALTVPDLIRLLAEAADRLERDAGHLACNPGRQTKAQALVIAADAIRDALADALRSTSYVPRCCAHYCRPKETP